MFLYYFDSLNDDISELSEIPQKQSLITKKWLNSEKYFQYFVSHHLGVTSHQVISRCIKVLELF